MTRFARRILALVALVSFFIMLPFVAAEEQQGAFVPKDKPGMAYTGTFADDYKFSLIFDLPDSVLREAGIKKKMTSKTSVIAEYDHQTISADSAGNMNACVRYYTKCYVKDVSDGKASRDNIDMAGKKFFFGVNDNKISMLPDYRIKDVGEKVILCDLFDPFMDILPKETLTKGLKWSCNVSPFQTFLNSLDWYSDEEGTSGYTVQSVSGIVTNITPKDIQFDITFNASYSTAGEDMTYVYPLEGKAKLIYSYEYSGILSASISMSGDCKVETTYDEVTIPLILNHTEKFTLSRKYKGVSDGTKPPKGKSVVFNTCFNDAPQLVASIPDKGKILLQANWTGTPFYEEYNTSGFGMISDLPTAAAFSPCGKSALVAFGTRVFISSNTGKTFKPLVWANAPIVRAAFCCSDPPSAILQCDDGTCYKLEVSNKTNAPSKINHPENKKIVLIAEGRDFDGYYLYDGNDIFRCPWGAKAIKIPLSLLKPITVMIPFDGGLSFIAGHMYLVKKDQYKERLTGLQENIICYNLDNEVGFFLCEDGTLSKLDYRNYEMSRVRDGVTSFSVRYATLFMATEDEVILEPIK